MGPLRRFLLEYSLTMNQAHYRDMLATIALIGAIGLVSACPWQLVCLAPCDRADFRPARRRQSIDPRRSGRSFGQRAAMRSRSWLRTSTSCRQRSRRANSASCIWRGTIRKLACRTCAPCRKRWRRCVAATSPGNIFGAIISINRFDQIRGAIGHGLFSRLVAEVATRASHSGDRPSRGPGDNRHHRHRIHRRKPRCSRSHDPHATAQAVSSPVTLDGDRIDVMVTAGLACDEEDAKAHLELLERAEVAVEQARAQRRITAWFDPAAYGDPATTACR